MLQIKKTSKIPVDSLKELENKPLMLHTNIIMFTDINVDDEYLNCIVHGYDFDNNKTIKITNKNYIESILTIFNLNELRNRYLDHLNELNAMQELERFYNKSHYMDSVIDLLKSGYILAAIKEYELATGNTLMTAKDHVYTLSEIFNEDSDINNYMDGVIKLIKEDKKFKALKIYKLVTDYGLKQAKDDIDILYERYNDSV